MTKYVWKLKDYGSGWSAREISDDMTDLGRGAYRGGSRNAKQA